FPDLPSVHYSWPPGSSASFSTNGSRRRGRPGGPTSSRTCTPDTRPGPRRCPASQPRSCSPRSQACSFRAKMRPVRVAVVGNLSLDLIDGAPPRVGGPPYYAARALATLGAPALVRAKSAEADRPLVVPPLEADRKS